MVKHPLCIIICKLINAVDNAKCRRFLSALIVISVGLGYTFAEQAVQDSLYFYSLPSMGGIGYNSISGFAQDEQGYIWCLTGDDILRFDGYQFRSYNDKITHREDWRYSYYSIVYTRSGNLYVSSSCGLFLYHPEKDSFEKVGDGSYRYVYEDNRGRVWLTNNAPVIFDPADETLTPLTIGGRALLGQFYTAADINEAYLITNDSIYILSLDETGVRDVSVEPFDLKPARIASIGVYDSLLYVLTTHRGLFARVDREWQRVAEIGDESVVARRMTRDKQGTIWVSTMRGLYAYNPHSGDCRHYRQTTLQGSLINNSVQTAFFDRDDNLWVGTYAGGICYASTHYHNAFRKTKQVDYGFLSLPISCMLADGENLWYGTEGDGLFCYNSGSGIVAHYSSKNWSGAGKAGNATLSSDNIKAIYRYGDDLWIATYLGGLNRLNINTGDVSVFTTPLISNQIYAFYPDENAGLWMIYQNMSNILTRLDLVTGEQVSYNIPDPVGTNTTSRLLHITRAGDRLWLATSTSIHCFSLSERQYLFSATPSPPVQIYEMAYDSLRQSLWLSTHAHGLIRYDITTNSFLPPILEHELGKVAVRAVVPDSDRLWLGTSKGIFVLTEQMSASGERLRTFGGGERLRAFGSPLHYDENDNVVETVISACSTTNSSGQTVIYMGGIGEWTEIMPQSVVHNNIAPSVLFSDIKINDHSVIVGNTSERFVPCSECFVPCSERELGGSSERFYDGELTLTYRENNIAITLSCTNFYLPDKNRYRFRLSSRDAWQEVDAMHRTISLMQMPAGHYNFEVQACNNDGVWGEISSLGITIKPAFWASLTAKIIYVFIALLIILFVALAVYRQYRLKNELYKAEVRAKEEERTNRDKLRFFTDISRELRTPLLRLLSLVDTSHIHLVQEVLLTTEKYLAQYGINVNADPKQQKREQMLDKLQSLVGERIADGHVDIDELAREMGMSRRKFFSFVKDETGKAPIEYIRSYRMQTAAKMMVERGLSVKEAMDEVGIESQSYFVKSFKDEFGTTPANYAEQYSK